MATFVYLAATFWLMCFENKYEKKGKRREKKKTEPDIDKKCGKFTVAIWRSQVERIPFFFSVNLNEKVHATINTYDHCMVSICVCILDVRISSNNTKKKRCQMKLSSISFSKNCERLIKKMIIFSIYNIFVIKYRQFTHGKYDVWKET